ncbi:MAG: helix-turn-helix domain-containing protein [bacterium]|nr:helix-turn-helix domain-containing protein [bacterium]
MNNVPENKIKNARQKAGLTQKAMSELFGIPKRTIENWDMGLRKPPHWAERLLIEKLEQIANERVNTEN